MIEACSASPRPGPGRARRQLRGRPRELAGFPGRTARGVDDDEDVRRLLLPDAGRATVAGVAWMAASGRARRGHLPEHTPLYREMRVTRATPVGQVHGLRAERRDAGGSSPPPISRATRTGGSTRCRRVTGSGAAAGLYVDLPVLVLDEPTSGLTRPRSCVSAISCDLAREKTSAVDPRAARGRGGLPAC